MATAFGKKFDKALLWSREQTLKPFAFRSAIKLELEGTKCDGVCEQIGKRYTIFVARRLKPHEAIGILLHECAHLNDWVKNGYVPGHSNQHGDSWGVEYSRLYRDYFEWRDRELEATRVVGKRRTR